MMSSPFWQNLSRVLFREECFLAGLQFRRMLGESYGEGCSYSQTRSGLIWNGVRISNRVSTRIQWISLVLTSGQRGYERIDRGIFTASGTPFRNNFLRQLLSNCHVFFTKHGPLVG